MLWPVGCNTPMKQSNVRPIFTSTHEYSISFPLASLAQSLCRHPADDPSSLKHEPNGSCAKTSTDSHRGNQTCTSLPAVFVKTTLTLSLYVAVGAYSAVTL